MRKELFEMSTEELWERFPIFLVPHNDKWKLYYDEMETFLKSILSEHPVDRISHIGSTAVSGIWAKNIVDILIEVSKKFRSWRNCKHHRKKRIYSDVGRCKETVV